MKYSLFRIYVWYSKFEDEWVAEGKWWSEDEFGFKKMKGTIGHHSFGESLSDAIDDILNVAKDMNIQIRDNLFLGYSEEFEYWNE